MESEEGKEEGKNGGCIDIKKKGGKKGSRKSMKQTWKKMICSKVEKESRQREKG